MIPKKPTTFLSNHKSRTALSHVKPPHRLLLLLMMLLSIECRGAQAWTKIVLDLNYILMLIYVYIHYHFCQSTFFNFFTLLKIQKIYQYLTTHNVLRTDAYYYNQLQLEEHKQLFQPISHLWKNQLACQYFK
ncbi:Hypothetical_protein [Hexamita inflata]|uniref:Hypothetical_protein n=1 Tax=Hexamita inflata TaxID=28002 RepID=A0AA86NKX8_9EUKA|nr:Hypothetical protein HINF_LOCUS8481 [Hexamita inflata]